MPTVAGLSAFVPDDLPTSIDIPSRVITALDRASLAVGTLAGVGETLPNPHLLVTPFLRREAVLSSRIEGSQASISDVFIYEASPKRAQSTAPDTKEVVNYVHAMSLGMRLLDTMPICVRLCNQLHATLMQGVRGEGKRPGELRTIQNWIGSGGTLIGEARFIPAPPDLVPDLMASWERFTNAELEMPSLVHAALMHYQFEAIHPYVDGNGSIGRLLIVLFLCQKRVLPQPLLYLSAYLEKNRDEYIDHLFRISSTGEWAPYLEFFLKGVEEQARDALERSRRLREHQEELQAVLQNQNESANAFRLLDCLFENPYTTAPRTAEMLGLSPGGAQRLVDRLVKANILARLPGKWPRVYAARSILEAIEQPFD